MTEKRAPSLDTEVAQILNAPSSRNKLFRHHTDVSNRPASRKKQVQGYDNVIFEDEDETPDRANTPKTKTNNPVTRHQTEVLSRRKDLMDDKIPTITIEAPPVTRRKISRCGSRVEIGATKILGDDSKDFNSKVFLKSTAHSLETRTKKLKSRIDETHRRISAHRDSKAIYPHVARVAFDRILLTLQDHNMAVVAGAAGEGKTYTALELLDHVTAEDIELRPVVIHHPLEFEEFMLLPATRYIFLVDDFLGKHDIDDSVYTEWMRLSRLVQKHVSSKRIYVIVTIRDTIMHKLSSLPHVPVVSRVNNSIANVVDLKEMPLTRPEKLIILTGFARLYSLDTDASQLESVAEKQYKEYGFPLMCRLMNIGPPLDVFSIPFQVICEEIESYRTDSAMCYLVLLVTMALDGRYPVDGFSKSQQSVFDRLKKRLNISDVEYKTLSSVVITLKDRGVLTYRRDLQSHAFMHDLIYVALLSNIYTNHSDILFEFCPIYIISQLFDTHNEETNDVHMLTERGRFIVTTKQFGPILARFKAIVETKSGKHFQSVSAAKLWDVDAFIELAVAMFGIDFFFKPDDNDNSLTVHFASIGKEKVTRKVASFIDEFHDKDAVEYQDQFRKAVIYACKYTHVDVVRHILKLVHKVTVDEMFASAEGGSVDIAKILASKGGDFFERRDEDKCTMFHWSCRFARTELVHYIVEHLQTDHDFDAVRRRDKFGRTACHFAAIGGDVDIMKYLIAHEFDPKAKAKDNTTVLHDACAFGMFEMVQFLCTKYPVLTKVADTGGFTTAHHAAREGHVDILQYLLEQGCDPRAKLSDGNGIMHLAAYNNRLLVIKYLLQHYPDLQHEQNNITFIPVQVAAQGGQVEVLDYFIAHGTNPYLLTVDMRTLLHLAAFNGQLELVKHLCTHYSDMVPSRDSEGNTVAHDGAASGHTDVVAYLLTKHIDPVAVSGDQCTLLHDACFYGKMDMAKYLVESYPQLLDMESSNGFTACHAAALGGYVDILSHLVRNHADPMGVSHDGGNLLHEAAFNGQLQMIRHLCKTYPTMVNARNHKSYTPSHFAAQEGHLDILSYLLQETEDELLLTEENQTHLHIASYNGRIDITQYLCREYPDMVAATDNGGAVAIHYASRGGNINVLTYLLEHTHDMTVETDSGSTILHLAAYDGNLEIVKLLCEQYPSLIPVADHSGHRACHYAAGSGHVELLKFILSRNVDHTVTTENGSTMLLKAAYNGKLDTVTYLCSQYPDLLTTADNFGCNALHYTACEGYTDVLTYLIEQDIDPMSRTNEEHTILHISAYHGKLPMVEYICETYPEMIVALDSNGQTAEQFAKLGGHDDVHEFILKIQSAILDDSSGEVESGWFDRVTGCLRRLVTRCRNCERQDIVRAARVCFLYLRRPFCFCRRCQS